MSLPKDLDAKIQEIADKKYKGDWTRAVLEELATKHPEAREFLDKNTTAKHNPKK